MGVFGNGDVDVNGAQEVNLRTSAGVELLGQQASAASLPVVISSDQSTLPISAASLPLPTGAATEATLSAINDGIPAALGQTTMANSMPVTIASDQPLLPTKINVDAGRMFGFAIEVNQAGTGEQDLILFRNPSGSGKTLWLTSFNWGSMDNITRFRIRIYQKPTVTSPGTAGTIFSHQVKGSPPTSSMLVYTVPTISARGTRMYSSSHADTGGGITPLDYGVSVAEGYDLLITGDTDATNKMLASSFHWMEQ